MGFDDPLYCTKYNTDPFRTKKAPIDEDEWPLLFLSKRSFSSSAVMETSALSLLKEAKSFLFTDDSPLIIYSMDRMPWVLFYLLLVVCSSEICINLAVVSEIMSMV